EQQLDKVNFNKAFMGMNGVDGNKGYTTPDIEEAAIKAKAIEQSDQAYVLVDTSKVNDISFSKVASIEECTIITNHLSDEQEDIKEHTIVMEA
ncbi:MAG: DeoR family transcriptional regulator, partial [Alkalibacterium sp.]|nr:DeoR family transcriptional regulator [Alkalibacterium sp.]